MRKTVTIAALLLSSLPLWGADCSCIYPIKPVVPCVETCRNALLMKLNKAELTTAVKLNEKTASQIVTLRKETGSTSFAGLEKSLPASDVKEIHAKFEQLGSIKGTELIKKYDLTTVKEQPAWKAK